MRKLWNLVLVLVMTLLFGATAYALDNHDPTFDLVPFTLDIGPPSADIDTSDDQATDFAYTIETETTIVVRYPAFSRHSKPVDSQTAAIAVHRLKYEVPWQYWQA